MFKLYVVWPNGHGYTKDLSTTGAVEDEIRSVMATSAPLTINVVWFEDGPEQVTEVAEPFGRVQVGQSAVHGTPVRD
jgi:hypothetical protein